MTGAVIALVVKEPTLAIPLSFVSHFVCDAIPHFGVKDDPANGDSEVFSKKFNIILITDFLLAVSIMALLGFYLFPEHKWVIWFSMIAAAIPDITNVYHRIYLERYKNVPYEPDKHFTSRIQWSSTYKGAYVEAAWFALMAYIIFLNYS